MEDEEIHSQHDPLHNTQQVGMNKRSEFKFSGDLSFTPKHSQVQCREDAINKGLDETFFSAFLRIQVKMKRHVHIWHIQVNKIEVFFLTVISIHHLFL